MRLRHLIPLAVTLLLILIGDAPRAKAQTGIDGSPGRGLAIANSVVASRRPITSSDLLALREIGGTAGTGLSLSPNRRYFAFELHQASIAENDYEVAWFVGDLSTGNAPIKVGEAGEAVLFRATAPNGRINGAWTSSYARWSPDSRGIAYRKLTDHQIQIWWSSRDGEGSRRLTNNAADIEEFHWSPDGSKIYFTTDADRAELSRLAADRYLIGHVFDYERDWSTVGAKPLYPSYELTGGRPRTWVLEFHKGVERPASDAEIAEFIRLKQDDEIRVPSRALLATRAEHNGAHAWLSPVSDDKQGRSAPMTLSASTGNPDRLVRCEAVECTGIFDTSRPLRRGIDWIQTAGEVLFARKAGTSFSKVALYAWRVGDSQVRRILTTDDWITDCSIVEEQAICFRESPTYPRTIVSIDLNDGRIRTLVDPNPDFKDLALGDVELIEWTNCYGHETFGYLIKPFNYLPDVRYPLVLIGYRAHTALRGGVGNEYPAHLLAKDGFAVVVYERPTNHEAEATITGPIDWSRANWGPDLFDYRMPLASFRAVIQLLSSRGLIDPDRVGVTGISNGVGHVNYALINSTMFAAAITSSSDFGPGNYFLVGSSDPAFREHRRTIGLGRPGSDDGFLWEKISLALNAEAVSTPLLINAADSEHPRALEEVISLMEHGKPVEMIVHPDEGHIKWQPAHRAAIYERNVDWFNFWLRGIEDPSPLKAPQYDRWQKLKDMQVRGRHKLREQGGCPGGQPPQLRRW